MRFYHRNNPEIEKSLPVKRTRIIFLVGVTGLEPTTSCSLSKHSSHLSYTPVRVVKGIFPLVGVAGLEPTASCSRSKHSTT